MAITSRDQLIAALANSQHVYFNKSVLTNAVAGRFYSLWRAGGEPAQAVIPGSQEVCTGELLGSMQLQPPPEPFLNYVAAVNFSGSLALNSVELHDRICHMAGLVGNVADLQATNLPLTLAGVAADRIGPEDFSQLQWWLEWYVSTGSTAAVATVTVVADDDSVHEVDVELASNSRLAGLYPIFPPAGKKGIKAVNILQLDRSTGTAGDFGVTCTRYRCAFSTDLANRSQVYDWAQLGLPDIHPDACLALIQMCTTSNTGNPRGVVRFAVG
ncbi:MAG: hypothetical protein EA413_00385 [Cyanobium sp. PLM2.Bin73]|nr:MAG: hypothetical protein EA413_00385 [Cyanobium sp. PLM2.Bin73]